MNQQSSSYNGILGAPHGSSYSYSDRSLPEPDRAQALDPAGNTDSAAGGERPGHRHRDGLGRRAQLSALSPALDTLAGGDAGDGAVAGAAGAAGGAEAGALGGSVFRGADCGGVALAARPDERLRNPPAAAVFRRMAAAGSEQHLRPVDLGRVSAVRGGTAGRPAGGFGDCTGRRTGQAPWARIFLAE